MLTALIVLARLILGVLFLAAGIAKLRDLAGTRRAVTGFGVPRGLVRPTALVLPCLEIAIALALLPAESTGAAAAAAAALLIVFVLAMMLNLARGRQPDCHCLGQVYSEPVSPVTITRNLVLVGIALFVALAGWHNAGPGIVGPIERLSGTALLAIEIAVVAVAILSIQARILQRIQRGQEETLDRLTWLENLLSADHNLTPLEFSPGDPLNVLNGDEAPGEVGWEDNAPAREAVENE